MNATLRAAVGARVARAQELMRSRGWDALWLGQSTNLRYLSGVVEKPSERLFGALIPAQGEPFMLVPRMYHEEMAGLSALSRVRSWTDEDGMADAIRRHFDVPREATLAVDPLLRAGFLFLLQEHLPNSRFVSGADLLHDMRLTKDDYEKECLRRAAHTADEVMAEITSRSLIGRSEQELAAEVIHLFGELGSEGISFSPICSAGPNAAFPHHRPDATRVEPGQCLVLDFGGVYEGYASDITRTVFTGEPSPDMRRVYQTVREAQQAAVEGLRPGMPAQAADDLARRHITAAGYGEAFIHRLGHGIGLDVHEPPFLVAGSNVPLSPGSAFSIEPGVYIAGLGGVRIEDIVVMNENAPELLNHAPRELAVIE